MRRLAQCALLGAVSVLAGQQFDRPAEPTAKDPARAEAPAAPVLRPSDVAAFLVRHRIRHDQIDIRSLTDRVNAAAARHAVDPAMVLAVIRVESTFQPAAVSSRGALGLMQILPDTGQALAAEMGVAWEGEHALLEPDLNIELGAYYLRKLLDRFGGDREAALEAYNIGPTRFASRRRERDPAPFVYARRVLPYWDDLR
jgi:soluble lytic murein transglycosylase-like protein